MHMTAGLGIIAEIPVETNFNFLFMFSLKSPPNEAIGKLVSMQSVVVGHLHTHTHTHTPRLWFVAVTEEEAVLSLHVLCDIWDLL